MSRVRDNILHAYLSGVCDHCKVGFSSKFKTHSEDDDFKQMARMDDTILDIVDWVKIKELQMKKITTMKVHRRWIKTYLSFEMMTKDELLTVNGFGNNRIIEL